MAEVERSVSSISAQEHYAGTKLECLTSGKNRMIVTACTKISVRDTARCAVVTMRRNGRSRSPKYARGKGGGEIGNDGDDRAANMAERNQLVKDAAQRMNEEQDGNGINGLSSTGSDKDEEKTSFSDQSKAAQSKRIDEQFSNVGETLGGEQSESYNSFRDDLEKRMAEQPNKPVVENINASFNRELNRTFGKGTGGNLKEISGGSYSGAKFKEMLSQYQDAQKALDNAGYDPKESKLLIEKANNKAKDSYLRDKNSKANDGDIELDKYLGEQLKQITKE
jgi:hypothetical protein